MEEEESWTFVGTDADTVDDLSSEVFMKQAVSDIKASPALGIRVSS